MLEWRRLSCLIFRCLLAEEDARVVPCLCRLGSAANDLGYIAELITNLIAAICVWARLDSRRCLITASNRVDVKLGHCYALCV